MMLAIVLAGSVARCATSGLCPTDEDIKSAIRDYEASIYRAGDAQVQKERPGDILMMTPQVIRRISDVYCQASLPDEAGSVRCKFTAHRGSKIEYYSSEMTRTADGWRLIMPLIVQRDVGKDPALIFPATQPLR